MGRWIATAIVGAVAALIVWFGFADAAEPWSIWEAYGPVAAGMSSAAFVLGGLMVRWAMDPAARAPRGGTDTAQKVAYAGLAALVLGVFLPFLQIPVVGSLTYFSNGSGDGVLVLITAMIAAVAVARRRFRVLWLTSAVVGALLIGSVLRVRTGVAEFEADGGNLFSSIFAAGVQLQVGFGVLLLGTVAMALAGYMARLEAAD